MKYCDMGSKYMVNVKDDAYYADRMLSDLKYIVRHMTDVSNAEFSENEILQDAMMFRLIQVSENARRLSDAYRSRHNRIPWGDVFGLRNRIVHDYGTVDLGIVYSTLAKDIPELLKMLSE